MVKYIFFSSCTKSLEPYNWLKLIVKLVPPVPPPSSTSSSRESSSSTSIPSLLRLLCPLSRLCHVVLCNLVQEKKDVLGCLHQLGPASLGKGCSQTTHALPWEKTLWVRKWNQITHTHIQIYTQSTEWPLSSGDARNTCVSKTKLYEAYQIYAQPSDHWPTDWAEEILEILACLKTNFYEAYLKKWI